jgi:hypothetical protein
MSPLNSSSLRICWSRSISRPISFIQLRARNKVDARNKGSRGRLAACRGGLEASGGRQ